MAPSVRRRSPAFLPPAHDPKALSWILRRAVRRYRAPVAAALMRRYRRSNPGIGLGDYLVAATALVEGLELATLNVRHFPMIEGITPPFPV